MPKTKNAKRSWLYAKNKSVTYYVASNWELEAQKTGWWELDSRLSIGGNDSLNNIDIHFGVYNSITTEATRKETIKEAKAHLEAVQSIRDHLDLIEEGLEEALDNLDEYDVDAARKASDERHARRLETNNHLAE